MDHKINNADTFFNSTVGVVYLKHIDVDLKQQRTLADCLWLPGWTFTSNIRTSAQIVYFTCLPTLQLTMCVQHYVEIE